jgi:phosphohistidine phosphatase
MSRTLWLLRHGDAEAHDSGPDFDRRLTNRGERQSLAAGRALARLGVVLEHAFTSPRVRALDTARIACAELGIEATVHPPLAGEFDEGDAAPLVAATDDGAALLLVGHEPDLSGLVRSLTAARIEMKKGGLAAVRVGPGRAELLLLLRPREIELLAQL